MAKKIGDEGALMEGGQENGNMGEVPKSQEEILQDEIVEAEWQLKTQEDLKKTRMGGPDEKSNDAVIQGFRDQKAKLETSLSALRGGASGGRHPQTDEVVSTWPSERQ